MPEPKTDETGKLIPKEKNAVQLRTDFIIQKARKYILEMVNDPKYGEKIVLDAVNAVRKTPKLAECTPESFLIALINAARTGLELSTFRQYCYIIPYKAKAEFQMGYKGYIELFLRSGVVDFVYAQDVKKGDDFKVILGTDYKIHHIPSNDPDRDKQPITHGYAVARLKSGSIQFVWLPIAEIYKHHRNRSKAYQSGGNNIWVTDEPVAVQKSMIIVLKRFMSISEECDRAVEADQAPLIGKPQKDLLEPEDIDFMRSEGLEVESEVVNEEPEPEKSANENEVDLEILKNLIESLRKAKKSHTKTICSAILGQEHFENLTAEQIEKGIIDARVALGKALGGVAENAEEPPPPEPPNEGKLI